MAAAAGNSGQQLMSSPPASQPVAPISPPSREISGAISSLAVGSTEERSEGSPSLDTQTGDADSGVGAGSGVVEGILDGVDGDEE